MLRSLLLAAALGLAACATDPAPPIGPSPPAGITDTSFTAADGTRAIQLSAWMPAPPAEVYQTIATAEGWKRWAAPSAFGEVKLNGTLETSYDANAKAGDAGNIKQQFLALVPDRLVVFRTTQTPAGFPNADLFMRTVTIIQLAPDAAGTRLTLTHSGFGREPGFDQLHGFFVAGNRQTLEDLQKLFVG